MNDLARLLQEILQTHLTGELERFMTNWPSEAHGADSVPPSAPPVAHWLDDLRELSSAATAALVEAFTRHAGQLHWRQTYSEADFGARFLQRYGYVELVGRRSRLFTDRMAAGLLMFGPDTHYPRHRHPAEEIYLPVAGTARYLMPDGVWKSAAPGTVIHNAPMVWHGTETAEQPVLIAWAWLGGDPAVKSQIN